MAGLADTGAEPTETPSSIRGRGERGSRLAVAPGDERTERIGELIEAARQRGAEMERPLDGVFPGLVPLDPGRLHRIAAAAGRALEVEVLADAELDTQFVED